MCVNFWAKEDGDGLSLREVSKSSRKRRYNMTFINLLLSTHVNFSRQNCPNFDFSHFDLTNTFSHAQQLHTHAISFMLLINLVK